MASEQERQSLLNSEAEDASYTQQQDPPEHMQLVLDPLPLIDVLKAYQSLGYHPSQGLLTAVEPFLTGQAEPLPLQQALDLITLFVTFHWQPGQHSSIKLLLT